MIKEKSPKHVSVENILCPGCGYENFRIVASGIDYDHNTTGDQRFQMVSCNQCGIFYLNPRPTLDELDILYDPDQFLCYTYTTNNPRLERALHIFEMRRARAALRLLPITKPSDITVLDIGAGQGSALMCFNELGVPLQQLYGSEISIPLAKRLQDKGIHAYTELAEHLTLPSNSFDIILLIHVIEHVADPRLVLTRILDLLKPGGILLLETPSIDGWDRTLWSKHLWGGYHFPRHWTLFSPKTISQMMTEVGFSTPHVSGINASGVWASSLNNLVQYHKLPKWLGDFTYPSNFPIIALTATFDYLPRLILGSSHMRVIASKLP